MDRPCLPLIKQTDADLWPSKTQETIYESTGFPFLMNERTVISKARWGTNMISEHNKNSWHANGFRYSPSGYMQNICDSINVPGDPEKPSISPPANRWRWCPTAEPSLHFCLEASSQVGEVKINPRMNVGTEILLFPWIDAILIWRNYCNLSCHYSK